MTNDIATLDLSQATLMESLSALAGVRARGVTFYDAKGRPERLSYDELWREALRFAAGLRKLKMAPGDPLVLILTDPKDAIIAILGSIAAGCPPAPVYPPVSAQAVPAFLQLVGHVATRSRARLVVAAEQVYPFLGTLLRTCPTVQAVRRFGALFASESATAERVTPDDVAFLQFTSGSTSAPKGVSVTHRCLATNLWMIRTASRMDEQSAVVTWLPVYHDMGLIGTVLNAITLQIELAVMSPRTFLRDPRLWLKAIGTHRGTHTAAPNFAYGLCKKRIADPTGLDLSSMRVFICGAEPIVPETLESFAAHFAPTGLEPTALVPAYGLAEATLAVSFTPYGTGLHTDEVDAAALQAERAAREPLPGLGRLRIPSSGVAMPGLEVAVRDPDSGEMLVDRRVGEIVVRGPSVTPGYIHDPEATRASRTPEGWLRTGDLGYLAAGRLFLCGRIKDVIIVRGRNVHAHDIEALASKMPDVRTGNVVAFGAPGPDGAEAQVVVVAEARQPDDSGEIARAVRGHVHDALGVVVDEVVVVPPGTLPKTSSGKLRRVETKARWAAGTLVPEKASRLRMLGLAVNSQLSFLIGRSSDN
jgi:fatty-acyl-CoA synthase